MLLFPLQIGIDAFNVNLQSTSTIKDRQTLKSLSITKWFNPLMPGDNKKVTHT